MSMKPRLKILEDDLVGRIIDEAMAVLAQTGVRVEDAVAFSRLTSSSSSESAATFVSRCREDR
jgi:trimethylamine:corrinoid methyltransferase-like protein